MTTAPLSVRQADLESGIRPFDLHRDLRQVADLVSEAFAPELDAASLMALRELRLLGRLYQWLGMNYLSSLNAFSLFDGFVCTDMSRVVGNVSLQKLDPYGQRWQIANMAVARSHQRRGIAHALLHNALRHLKQAGAQYAVLQVRADNHVARDLYVKYGFRRMGGIAELAGRSPLALKQAPTPGVMQPVARRDWRKIFALAQSQMEHHQRWWRPLKSDEFRLDWPRYLAEELARLIGVSHIRRFGVQYKSGHYAAAAIVHSRYWQGDHQVTLWTRPQLYGTYEQDLVGTIGQAIGPRPGLRIRVKVDADHAEALALLQASGLQHTLTLDTMRCVLRQPAV